MIGPRVCGAGSSALRVVVAGRLVGAPFQGGAAWAVLQYILGLRALGHSVVFVQPVEADGVRADGSVSPAYAGAFHRLCRDFGLAESAALLLHDGETIGLPDRTLERRLAEADVLLNLSGVLPLDGSAGGIDARVYVDLDPAFTQLWEHADGIDMGLGGHTHFATVGLAIGRPECPVPTLGRPWIHFLPPVFLPEWPRAERAPRRRAWTTVANWRAYGSITHDGTHYGQKAHAIRELIDLPSAVHRPLHIALHIHPDERGDLAALREAGWHLVPPSGATGGVDRYRAFISESWGELGIAKSGYVASRCGWVSDRSACYLASGRPVIAQDTGFGAHLPTGLGLLSFVTRDDAAGASEAVCREYDRHGRAARELAETLFDSRRVLSGLLAAVGVA